ncbi:MAG: hypothetical protein WBM55_03330, partial [Muriicola sp.]
MKIKQFSIIFLLLFVCSFSGLATISELSGSEITAESPIELFKANAKVHNIVTKSVKGYANVYNGYYLITGVFGVSENAHKFAGSLKNYGATPGYFKSPENGMHYVYLEHFSIGEDAISSYLNGKYKKKMWILHVENSKKNPSEIKEIVTPTFSKPALLSHKHFVSAAKKYKIAARTVEDITSIDNGYYAVAGVFGDKNNVLKFVKKLKSKGLAVSTAENTASKLTYVYLDYSKDWAGVLETARTQVNGKYGDKLWIMHIANEATSPGKSPAYTPIAFSAANSALFAAEKNVQRKSLKAPLNKILEKADEYFDKMWYAEAADLYESFLTNNKDNYTYEVIQKAGDSHYFNSNMERAYYWYDILYNRYNDDISAENIFKYAHSLKGTGKYARAKRLMRLYDRKVKKEGMRYSIEDPRTTPKEKVLDNILNTELEYTIRNIK